MRLSRVVVVGLSGLLVVGVVPGSTAAYEAGERPAVAPAAAGLQRATATCTDPARQAIAVRKPRFVRQIETGETGWFSSPGLVDVTGNRKLEIVAPFYSTFVFNAKGRRLGRATATPGRVYAPSVTTDLEGDGVPDIVVGGTGKVAAYRFVHGRLRLKRGWPASVRSGGQTPEVRGLAAADLNRDGRVEVVATTTNTSSTGAQVFVFNTRGNRFQPKGGHKPAWPRYNTAERAGQRPALQRGRQPRVRRVRRERRHRQHRRRPQPGDHRHLRQPPDQRVQPRRHLDPGVALVHEPGVRGRGSQDGVGAVHPMGQPRRRAPPLPPAQGARGPARRGSRGCSGPRRHRRWPTWTATAATRSSGSPTSRSTSRTAPRGTRSWCWTARTARGTARLGVTRASSRSRCRTTRSTDPTVTGIRRAGSQRRPWSTSAGARGPRSSPPFPAARCTRSGRTATASGPSSTPRAVRRPSPPRSSQQT